MLIGVTGAGGFIGSHLVERILAEGHRVRAFIHYNSMDSIGKLPKDLAKNKNVEFVFGDLRDPRHCDVFCYGIDVVYHLGAIISVPYSDAAPWHVFENNTRSTLNLLESTSTLGVRFIGISTSEVYGDGAEVLRENSQMQPQSVYAVSKLASDMLIRTFFFTINDFQAKLIRPFNTYGPRQSKRAVIMRIVRQAINEGHILLQNGDTSRDFVYVTDTVDALWRAGMNDQCGVYNVATGTAHTIKEIALRVAKLVGIPDAKVECASIHRPGQVHRLCGDATSIRETFGWEPKVGIDEGLDNTIRWAMLNEEGPGEPL